MCAAVQKTTRDCCDFIASRAAARNAQRISACRQVLAGPGANTQARVCCRFIRGRAGAGFLREARREESDLVVPNERRVTPPRTKTGPALRVAREMAPAVVAGLDKGITITCVLRLTGDRSEEHTSELQSQSNL